MEVIDKLIEQAPYAAALLAVVVVFVRFIRSESDKREERAKAHDTLIIKLVKDFEKGTQECHEVQLKTVECVTINNDRLKENTKMLGRVGEALARSNGGTA